MARKETDKKEKTLKPYWFLRNIFWACVLVLALVFLTQRALNTITRHNQEIEVPDLRTLSLEQAAQVAADNSMRIDVTDSVFVKRLARGAVYGQNPEPGSKVKKNRRIMLTINATQPKTVAMPSLVGFSLRQAKTELMSRGLTVGKLIYVDDMATNNVLEQRYNGNSIRAGRKIEAESPIDLVLGLNYEESLTYIPQLTGLTFAVAKDAILDNSLNVGKVRYDETVETYQDSLQAVVYSQSPAYSREAPFTMGTEVSIYLTKSQVKVKSSSN